MWMLVILVVLISDPDPWAQLILGCALTGSYLFLLIYDVISSTRINSKFTNVLFDGDLLKLDAI